MFPDRRTFLRSLAATRWSAFETAYGPALLVPWWLAIFRFAPTRCATMAGHKLWGSLCHQHAYISSAALPAAPFIIDVLGRQQAPVVEEALDIMLGFIRCTVPSMVDAPPWHSEVRTIVLSAGPTVRRLAAGADPSVADMARMLLFEAGIVAT